MPGPGDTFEGSPYWFSGAGERRTANPFWTDPAKAAQRAALARAAISFGVDPEVYYNALVHSGRAPETMTPESFSATGGGAAGLLGEAIYKPGKGQWGQPGYVPAISIPKLLWDFQQQSHLPGMEEKYGPYSKRPGLLKSIADITAARLEERAKMAPSDRVYQGKRLATFDPAQETAHTALEGIAANGPANAGTHQSILDKLQALQNHNPLAAAHTYLQRGTSAVSDAERGAFRQSAMEHIVNPLHEKMRRDLLEKVLPAIDTNRIMHGNLYGGGRDKMRQRVIEDFGRNSMEVALPHLFEAEQRGQQAGERQRQAQINAGQISAPAEIQAMGAQREAALSTSEAMRNRQLQDLVAAEAGLSAGAARQQHQQQALNIAAQNWDAEQRGLLDEAAAAAAIARGQNVPSFTSSTSPVVQSPGFASTIGSLAVGGGLMNMMDRPKTAKAGGRMKLATGGIASGGLNNPYSDYRKSLLDMIMGGLQGPDQSMASQAVQQDMLNQTPPIPQPQQPMGGLLDALPSPLSTPVAAPEAPALETPISEAPAGGPLERGGQSALTSLEKMNQYRSKMEQKAASLDRGDQDVNPMLPFLARTFIGAAGSKNMNLGERIGEGAQHGYQAFEQQRAANARNKELSLNIEKALLETHQKEYEHEKTLQMQKEIAAAKNSGRQPKVHYNKKTNAYYTLGDNGVMVPIPMAGGAGIITPEQQAEQEIQNKIREAAGVEKAKTQEKYLSGLEESIPEYDKNISIAQRILAIAPDVRTGVLHGKTMNVADKAQLLQSLSNEVTQQLMSAQKGPQTDQDRDFLQKSAPNPSDNTDVLIKKSNALGLFATRKNAEASFKREMASAGIDSADYNRAWSKFNAENPIVNNKLDPNPIKKRPESYLKSKKLPEDYQTDLADFELKPLPATKDDFIPVGGPEPEGEHEVTITPYSPQSNVNEARAFGAAKQKLSSRGISARQITPEMIRKAQELKILRGAGL
jgi:hypothetical protein